jgi:hypothetical protein
LVYGNLQAGNLEGSRGRALGRTPGT